MTRDTSVVVAVLAVLFFTRLAKEVEQTLPAERTPRDPAPTQSGEREGP